MNRDNMLEFLSEFEALLPEVKWEPEHSADPEVQALKTEAFIGTTGDWRATAVAFDIEPQGFPKGTRGYDGAVVNHPRGIVCRMTREIAERVFKAAAAATRDA